MKKTPCLVSFLFPAAALAQPVFFDDFDGDALLPHWRQPPPAHWDHHVSNSVLSVTGLHYPSMPGQENFAGMSAAHARLDDFRVDVWMNDGGRALGIDVLGQPGAAHAIASVYTIDHGTFLLALVNGQPSGSRSTPSAGMHLFTITRTASRIEFFFDGVQFGSGMGAASPAQGIYLSFRASLPGFLVAQVDRVQVLPAPWVTWLLPVIALARVRRRRENKSE